MDSDRAGGGRAAPVIDGRAAGAVPPGGNFINFALTAATRRRRSCGA
jgi:hypothetical protein